MLSVARHAQWLQLSRRLVRQITMASTTATMNGGEILTEVGITTKSESPVPAGQSSIQNVARVPIPPRGVDYRGKVVLAPMVRSGELPSRLLALHYGADLVWGPETVDRSMIGTRRYINSRTGCMEWSRPPSKHAHSKQQVDEEKENIIFRIDQKRESARFIFQIGTNDPERAVTAATLVAPYCAGIDVNAGCPKPFSTDGGMGAALLTTENGDLLVRILTALVAEVGKPHEIGISVKIRLLSTPEETSALVHKLCKTGITGLTIHCRTRPMRPRERAIRDQLRMIGGICHSYGIACLMNGDVTSRDEGMKLAAEYGVDGAMIATAAEANSSVFLSEEQGGKQNWRGVVTQYLKFALEVENRFANTKFLLGQLMPGKDPAYRKICQSKSYTPCIEVLGLAGEGTMLEDAKRLDEILGLDPNRTTRQDVKKANKVAEREKQEANIAAKKKRALESDSNQQNQQKKRDRKKSPLRNQTTVQTKTIEEKAKDAAENAGFEGIGQGALQVAV